MSSHRLALSAALVVLTIAAYVPRLNGTFLWDDDEYITSNEALKSMSGFAAIWLAPGATPRELVGGGGKAGPWPPAHARFPATPPLALFRRHSPSYFGGSATGWAQKKCWHCCLSSTWPSCPV